jgi:3-methyladenine DNA glycosylase AlkD
MFYDKLTNELNKLSNPQRAKISAGFFKTGKGEYGEGDVFLGITVPEQRKVAMKFLDLNPSDISRLLNSKIHEHRFTALEILVIQYEKEKDRKKKEKIKDFYLKNLKFVNNWDLVDTSAPYILGDFLIEEKDRSVLYKLASSKVLWYRRVAVVSTFAFIKQEDFRDIINICEKLIDDKEDLIQKACGWMLREVGKKDVYILKNFLNKFDQKMSRTTLRYAIERFDKKERQKYLNGKV